MTYEETLDTGKVEEHPMEGFKEMANISTGGDFGDQFAQLINELTTNVIIPTDDEDTLKQWAAEHAGGERVYAEIGGELRIAEPDVADPSGPDDIELKDVGGDSSILSETEPSDPSENERWTDTSYVQPEEKVYVDGEWKIISPGSHVPSTTTLTDDETFDVSDIDEIVTVTLQGGNASGAYLTSGGDGGYLNASVDLATVETLSVEVPHEEGDPPESSPAASGADSVAVFADSERILAAGGGGGGADNRDDGGNGGGPNGGSGGDGSGNKDGGDGGPWDSGSSVIIGINGVTGGASNDVDSGGEVQLF